MDDHPGGDEVMVSSTGKDATNDFEDVGHSRSARDMLVKYYIGDIDSSTVPRSQASIPPPLTSNNAASGSSFMEKIMQLLVPILILGFALAVRNFTKVEWLHLFILAPEAQIGG